MRSPPTKPRSSALFRVVNRYVGNFAPTPGVFPDYPAQVLRNTETGLELSMMRWAHRLGREIGGGQRSRCRCGRT
jgi:hypothetical protein